MTSARLIWGDVVKTRWRETQCRGSVSGALPSELLTGPDGSQNWMKGGGREYEGKGRDEAGIRMDKGKGEMCFQEITFLQRSRCDCELVQIGEFRYTH